MGNCCICTWYGFSANHANAGEKTKQEWNALYVEAGCMDLNFFQKEICKTKVFQKTNWTEKNTN